MRFMLPPEYNGGEWNFVYCTQTIFMQLLLYLATEDRLPMKTVGGMTSESV